MLYTFEIITNKCYLRGFALSSSVYVRFNESKLLQYLISASKLQRYGSSHDLNQICYFLWHSSVSKKMWHPLHSCQKIFHAQRAGKTSESRQRLTPFTIVRLLPRATGKDTCCKSFEYTALRQKLYVTSAIPFVRFKF